MKAHSREAKEDCLLCKRVIQHVETVGRLYCAWVTRQAGHAATDSFLSQWRQLQSFLREELVAPVGGPLYYWLQQGAKRLPPPTEL
jgi:hypothetical protein